MAQSSGRKGIAVLILVVVGLFVLVCGGAGVYVALQVKEVAELPPDEMATAIADKMGVDTAAENERAEAFLVALREHRFTDATAMTTQAFRLSTGERGLATLQERIETALGAYQSKFLSNFHVRHKTVNGVAVTTSDVTYTATFERGEGTVAIRFVTQADGTLSIESFQVNSPQLSEGR